ncbi:MAG TPA: GNAT family N-acetyltransferase [Rhodanobacteraceae bacterium]|jgi:predicted GNAT family acetyltransferase|nr:GNAT family N-acetyltransferase [Rhodanobacteraceae bacterium]
MTVPVSHDPGQHRFEAKVEGLDATLDYVLDDDGLHHGRPTAGRRDDERPRGRTMTITHVRVPEPIAGRGIAGDLTAAALAHARRERWRVIPQCPYAAAYVRRHPQWSDVLETR